ncbi:LOG family protein [Candidatus Woesearchaeota archaeon]|nr:LOG family protein [Candidatus Woesearchaeota archaeon]
MDKIIDTIRGEKQVPIIGVIGATNPTEEYSREMGISVGYALRKFGEDTNCSIFTGGVEGVGLDVYGGIIKYCLQNGKGDDFFFTLIPEFDEGQLNIDKFTEVGMVSKVRSKRAYRLPSAYHFLRSLLSPHDIAQVMVGKDMNERRKYVAEVADALVMVNGGLGTLDEAFNALKRPIPVFTLGNTGGMAEELASLRDRPIPPQLERALVEQGIRSKGIHKESIYLVSDIKDLDRQLRAYFSLITLC